MNQRRSVMFNGATIEGTVVLREGLQFFVEDVKPIDSETGVRGRKCGVCNKWFTTLAKLKKHHKMHQHPVHCCQTGCNYKAAEFKDILRHVQSTHRKLLEENPKFSPIECNECGRKYTRQDHYTRHKTQGLCVPVTNTRVTPLQKIMEEAEEAVVLDSGEIQSKVPMTELLVPPGPGSSEIGRRIRRLAVQDRPIQNGCQSSSRDECSDGSSSDGEVLSVNSLPQKRGRDGKVKEESENEALWVRSIENVNRFARKGLSVEELQKVPLHEYASSSYDEHPGFSSTVLHIPDSTEAMLTAVNSAKDKIFSKQSSITREIDLEIPPNTIVKLKINMIVKR